MYRVGEEVVCINVGKHLDFLEYGKVYTIKDIFMGEFYRFYGLGQFIFDTEIFISITDYRKQKIDKICANIKQVIG